MKDREWYVLLMMKTALALFIAFFIGQNSFATDESQASIEFSLTLDCQEFFAGTSGETRFHREGKNFSLNVLDKILSLGYSVWTKKRVLEQIQYTSNGSRIDFEANIKADAVSPPANFEVEGKIKFKSKLNEVKARYTLRYDPKDGSLSVLSTAGIPFLTGVILNGGEQAWSDYFLGNKSLVAEFTVPLVAAHGRGPGPRLDGGIFRHPAIPPYIKEPIPISFFDQNGRPLTRLRLELGRNFIRPIEKLQRVTVRLNYEGKGPE